MMAGKTELVKKDMLIGKVVALYPQTIPVFLKYGLHCIGCSIAASESVEQGAFAHGMDEKMFAAFMKDLNKAAMKKGKEEV